MPKLNCWEFKNCGRQIGGSLVDRFGVCPASQDKTAQGIHGGKNGGRCCWVISDTCCDGRRQGNFGQKVDECMKCDFYTYVEKEEAGDFLYIITILNKIKNGIEKKAFPFKQPNILPTNAPPPTKKYSTGLIFAHKAKGNVEDSVIVSIDTLLFCV